ncbi:restriction endonuclease subunit S [uncultured Phocaeicola sp.]|uniref:restriction endonuclease subunit S n=1 Tax=uncultured Phocaeicola sp. TaxID=990718 RepID=UPI002633FDE2|nr:restriction endonuclease subunit S [uncultured Phocaeicola sp.]MCI8766084.1 restriction endonuclease subunit S [Lachnospiraceae bacterium]
MSQLVDSGIEWLDFIPSHWTTSKIDALYTLRNEKVSDRDFAPLSVTNKGIVPQLETAAKSDAHDDRKLVRKGDFAINSRSDRRGSCGISPMDGSVSLINTILAPNTEMNPEYYDWLFHTVQFGDEFYKWGHGIVDDLWTTGWQDMKKISIPTPPLEEQDRIARFLNSRCSEIDDLINSIQTQIEVMEQYKRSVIISITTKGLNNRAELKETGIEYASQIPVTWNMHPLYVYFGERKHKNSLGRENNLLSLSYGKIIQKDINTNEGLLPESFNTYNIIEAGDIIIRPTDLQNDKRSLRTGLAKEHGIITSAYIALMAIKPVNTAYFHYLLHAFDVMKVFYNMGNGVRQGLNFTEFSRLIVFEPPIEEQNLIAEYLDNKCAEIDSIIADKNKQLEILDQYKKSLIYEYVTGKKEVPV